MPIGIYIRTEEYRKNMGDVMRGKKRSKECIERNKQKWIENLNKITVSGMKGKHHSEKTKRKLSLIFKGIRPKTSKEIIEKIRNKLKGRKNPLVQGDKSPLYKHGLSATKQYIKNMKQRRYAFERGGGELSTKTVQLVYEDNIKRYGTLTCIYCLKVVEFGQDTLEHKVPLSKGGTNEYNNLAIACRHCNSMKGILTEEEYKKILEKGQGYPLA